MNLTIDSLTTNETNISSCDYYHWQVNGNTYTTSGIYSFVNGCHTEILNLTINSSVTDTVTISSCGPYLWNADSIIRYNSGVYLFNSGCTTHILQLEIISASSDTIQITSCDHYLWPLTGIAYTASGYYQYQSVNAAGCDSIIVLDLNILNNCTAASVLYLKCYLQGFYAASGQMYPVLLNQGVVNSTGAETDTIVVELRDSLDPSVVVSSVTSLLMTDGTSVLSFNDINAGSSYWIVVKHRNSVQTWSANTVLMTDTTLYDFSISDTQAYANNMVEVEPGIWALYSADINQDEYVDSFDFPIFESDMLIFVSGYFNTDLNGDGYVDSFDFPLFELNMLNFVQSIHP